MIWGKECQNFMTLTLYFNSSVMIRTEDPIADNSRCSKKGVLMGTTKSAHKEGIINHKHSQEEQTKTQITHEEEPTGESTAPGNTRSRSRQGNQSRQGSDGLMRGRCDE